VTHTKSLPNELRVDGHRVRIRRRRIPRARDGYPQTGQHVLGRITIAPGLTSEQERVTLIHEILHECFARAEVRVRRADEEYIVSSIEPWLAEILRDRRLLEYLAASAE
jgi:hypothetical protein